MAFSGTTTYLGLRVIAAQDRNWLADANFNLQKTDTLAKHLRPQAGDGTSMGIRAKLASGALVEAIKIESIGTALRIHLGRAGSSDTVILQGSALIQATLRLLNVSDSSKTATVRTVWSNEGPDALQDTTLDFNTRNNKLTRVKFPLMGTPTIDNTYVGSAAQFELDPAGTALDTSWVSYEIQQADTTAKNYIQPVYKL